MDKPAVETAVLCFTYNHQEIPLFKYIMVISLLSMVFRRHTAVVYNIANNRARYLFKMQKCHDKYIFELTGRPTKCYINNEIIGYVTTYR